MEISMPRVTIYTTNFCRVDWQPVDLWFSYNTLIAFRAAGCGLVIHQNVWSKITGKHLSQINSDKSIRVSAEEFDRQWQQYVVPALVQYAAPAFGFDPNMDVGALADFIKEKFCG